jgi:NAD(P)H-flavin reductase/ferredoxin
MTLSISEAATSMTTLTFNHQQYQMQQDETVLDCLLRHQQLIPHACKAGMCQACLIKAVNCEATEASRKGIKPGLQTLGYSLACQWRPAGDIEVALPAADELSVIAVIKTLTMLNHRVMRVCLEIPDPGSMFHYYPGQYLTLTNSEGISRSYSTANNLEMDGHIELHIANTRQGVFTGWLFEKARAGELLHIRGPAGDCFYSERDGKDYPIVMAGTNTGLAPLIAIAREALRQGHQHTITLYHGGRTQADLYYVAELQTLAESFSNFHYQPSCLELDISNNIDVPGNLQCGALDDLLIRGLDQGSIGQSRFFLCGAADFVHQLRKKIFLKGARSAHIFCDAFLERSVSAND